MLPAPIPAYLLGILGIYKLAKEANLGLFSPAAGPVLNLPSPTS